MSIVPTGNPAWVRTNAHTVYGGNINKTNFQSIGTVNPRTDLSAENVCRIATDLAAVARTTPFAVMTFDCNDTVPAAPSIVSYYAMAGSSPTGVRNGTGDVTFTWQNSYTDDYGISGNMNIVAWMPATQGVSLAFVNALRFDTDADGNYNQLLVRAFNNAGAALANARITLCVWTG